jgi:hypothetical protein
MHCRNAAAHPGKWLKIPFSKAPQAFYHGSA